MFGHRGARATAPENTVPAFDRAIEIGADGLEFDVRLSRDGVAMVFHDRTLERTTNGTGRLADLTSSELASLDAAYRFGEAEGFLWRGRGVRIPTLEAVLARYTDIPLILEMKGRDRRLPLAALEPVRRAGALDRVCFGSFSFTLLERVRRLEPAAVTSASRADLHWALLLARLGLRPRFVRYQACQMPLRFRGRPVLSPRLVKSVRMTGVPVDVWTVNDPADVTRLLELEVEGFITDCPDLVRSALS